MAEITNYTPGEYAKEHIRITPTTLADGRDFFYLDDDPEYVSGAKTRELKDPRPLDYRFAPHLDADGNEVPYAAPQMRRDPLTGDWIPMATARMNRPITAGPGATAKGNPLAARKPGDPYQDGEVPDTDYNVVVFENRFPSMVRVPGVSEDVTYVDGNPHQLRFVYNTYRFTTLEEIKEFEPELVINAVTVKYTLDAFRKILPVLPKDCIISDIASVKTGLKKFYEESGFRYVSSHPMFGPTFASLSNLSSENAIIISEGDHLGKIFFKDLYQTLRLNIFEYTFDEHDETVAYSLSIPFVSTFVFAAVMKHQEAPGTTFKKHMAIAKGLLSEDDYLLQEILFNPRTPGQVTNIRTELKNLLEIIENKDAEGMKKYLTKIREKIK